MPERKHTGCIIWPSMTFEIILYLMKNLCLYKVGIHIKVLIWLDGKQKCIKEKEGVLNKKVKVCDF